MTIDYNKDRSVVIRTKRQPVEIKTAPYPYYPANPSQPVIVNNPEAAWWESLPTWGSGGYDVDNARPSDPRESLTPEQANLVREIENLASANKNLTFISSKTTSEFAKKKYHSYAYTGVDMVPSVAIPGQPPYIFGDISTLSISTHRESFPVRMLGRTNPMGFTHGPRTVAGSMIFSVMDMYPWYKMAEQTYQASGASSWDKTTTGIYPMADALPPFDITVTFNNEYEDSGGILRIFGVTIIDDGMTLSIDDLVTENTYSFMAAGIAPLHRAKGWTVDAEQRETT